jgi:predicted nucleotidyltransferase
MRKSKQKKVELLKKYFKKKKSVVLAFLFGSQAKEREMGESDWDIGIYFKPKEYLELETNFDYPEEEGMWSDLVDILKTDNVDLVILNRARPDLVYTVLRDGIPLIIRDKGLYF